MLSNALALACASAAAHSASSQKTSAALAWPIFATPPACDCIVSSCTDAPAHVQSGHVVKSASLHPLSSYSLTTKIERDRQQTSLSRCSAQANT
eukprot:scaffold159990_cov24-Prasinocladus_malaysianus.AAC.1